MKEAGLRGRACVLPGILAGLGMVGMGFVSDGIVAADVTSVTDTLSITVLETCTFRDVSDLTFTGSALSGSEVENFSHSGVHEFNVFCNSSNGYTVSATPYDLEAEGDITDVIAYTDDYTPSGRNGLWTAEITSDTPGITVTNPVPVGGGVIVSSGTNTLAAGTTFTATYSAYVGSITPAGTYVGRIEYSLSSLSGGNGGGGSNHQDSGDDNTGNEETGDTENDNGSGSGGQTGDQTGGSETGGQTGGSETDNSQNSTNPVNANSLNAAPAMTTLNNSYSTNNVNNTYTTYNTSYQGGGSMSSTTGGTTSAATTSGDDNEDSTNPATNSENNSNTSSSYVKPLGVTSTTKSTSSTESDSMDPMPIVAAGAVTAAAVAGVALMRSGKKEENKK